MMRKLRDSGPLVAAIAAILIAATGWLRSDGSRSQQLADVQAQVSQISQQMQRLQQEIDEYLLHHDGH